MKKIFAIPFFTFSLFASYCDAQNLDSDKINTKTPCGTLNITTYYRAASPIGSCTVVYALNVSGGTAPYTYSWTPGGYTTDTIKNLCPGTYCCTITDNNGCSATTCASPTGINNIINNSPQITIYPNPGNGIFTIALSHAELVSASQTIEVYNVLGEEIYYATLKQVQGDNTVDISNQPNGIYLYRVIANNGELMGEGKLIIQK